MTLVFWKAHDQRLHCFCTPSLTEQLYIVTTYFHHSAAESWHTARANRETRPATARLDQLRLGLFIPAELNLAAVVLVHDTASVDNLLVDAVDGDVVGLVAILWAEVLDDLHLLYVNYGMVVIAKASRETATHYDAYQER